ncbi:formylglycine-generating enzyme family protein [Colwelliaceae bacterium BS250]
MSPNVLAEQQSETEATVAAKYQELLKQYDMDMPDPEAVQKSEMKSDPFPEVQVDTELKPHIDPKKDSAALHYAEVLKQQGLDPDDFGKKPDAENDRVYALSDKSQKQLLDDMIWVEGGSFTMGSEAPEATNREKPAHKVTLDGFYIGKTELTQALFEELMGWNVSYFECGQCAMNNVSWSNIQLFIERLNKVTGKEFRLPTEAEWEYAAKGGIKSKNFRFSGSNNIEDVAWYAGNGQRKSHPVAQKQANELGLYDMTGNLWEFVHDDMVRSIYTKEERVNPVYLRSNDPKQKTMKVIRGGGYEFSANESLMFKRDGATNNVRMPDIGFRLALTSKEASKQASK